jgi:hypothetical protein
MSTTSSSPPAVTRSSPSRVIDSPPLGLGVVSVVMLENRLNVILGRLRVIEEALHGEHFWCLRLAGETNSLTVPAQVSIFDEGVRFIARIPADVAHSMVELLMDGDVVQATNAMSNHSQACVFMWELKVESPLAVA